MKVRILSGNQAGTIVEMEKTEAEVNFAAGFVEAVLDEAVEPVNMSVTFPPPDVEVEHQPLSMPPRLGRRR